MSAPRSAYRLAVTWHAVDRFVERWRPGADRQAARAELSQLAADAVPTRRMSLNRDARIYTVGTPAGESIFMAVRDDVVVTVLAPVPPAGPPALASADETDEHALEVAEIRAMSMTDPATGAPARANEFEAAQRARLTRAQAELTARSVINGYVHHGQKVRPSVLERACALLGIPVPDAPKRPR